MNCGMLPTSVTGVRTLFPRCHYPVQLRYVPRFPGEGETLGMDDD